MYKDCKEPVLESLEFGCVLQGEDCDLEKLQRHADFHPLHYVHIPVACIEGDCSKLNIKGYRWRLCASVELL